MCLVLTKRGSDRREWLFVGEFVVREVKRVGGEEFSRRYAARAVEVSAPPFPKAGEWAWVIEFEGLRKYERVVKLGELCDVKTSTSEKPLCDWMIVGFVLLRSKDFEIVVSAVRARVSRPSHDELVMELVELGEWLGFVVSREEHTPDGLYRLDVVWIDEEGHAPLKAFEVELSGEIDKALARLAHAYDMWRCDQLPLIVSDETKAERALRLVEPRLRGSFARIEVAWWFWVGRSYTASIARLNNTPSSSKNWRRGKCVLSGQRD